MVSIMHTILDCDTDNQILCIVNNSIDLHQTLPSTMNATFLFNLTSRNHTSFTVLPDTLTLFSTMTSCSVRHMLVLMPCSSVASRTLSHWPVIINTRMQGSAMARMVFVLVRFNLL